MTASYDQEWVSDMAPPAAQDISDLLLAASELTNKESNEVIAAMTAATSSNITSTLPYCEIIHDDRISESDCRAPQEPTFQESMDKLQERIYRGIKTPGQIDNEEAERLQKRMVELTAKYREFSKDGLTDVELKELNRDLRMQSLRVFHDRHDNDKLPEDGKPFNRLDIAARLENQHDRIVDGVRNGSLTENEYSRLDRQQIDIQLTYDRLKNDRDGLTLADKELLARQLDRTGRQIFHDKHDRDIMDRAML